ncbi:hypothetical protein Taro_055468 [Colocasia esculenta]|uniref:Uncharacterized protein n=1 Tax=Colocasia esculenta TaxID=4460 RepID=A0A843XT17_COLES|nr:hypothetical protein [Colocasia esculenta]
MVCLLRLLLLPSSSCWDLRVLRRRRRGSRSVTVEGVSWCWRQCCSGQQVLHFVMVKESCGLWPGQAVIRMGHLHTVVLIGGSVILSSSKFIGEDYTEKSRLSVSGEKKTTVASVREVIMSQTQDCKRLVIVAADG